PPERELPPFRAGHVKPPARAWWQVRQPLAWAATVVVALGIGTYLGRGVEQPRQPDTDTEPARPQALESPLSSERARREARVKLPGAAGTPRAAQPARPAPATPDRADYLAQQHDAQVAARAEASSVLVAPTPAPQAGVVSIDARRDVLTAAPAGKLARRLAHYETRNWEQRRLDNLEMQISGPLPNDSLQKLLQLVQPVKP